MGDYMTLDRLVAMVDAFIRCDSLCEGCEIDDDHGIPCDKCRKQAADRIEEILMDNERQINRAELFNKLAEIKAPPEATGNWVRLEREENVYDLHGVPTWGVNYMCDNCGFITTAIQDHFEQYKFCPHCGKRLIIER